ncbi:MAG: hypothetical protein Q7T34_00605, partial [Candidatus Parcubacteria bacterium]|nr:hypothetical protein [Candidatus Parcubacteria bacterium]
MKICFLLQRKFSVFGTAMAKLLKDNYGVTDFCGYTFLRTAEKFLKSQTSVIFNPLLVEEDLFDLSLNEKVDYDYLKSLEEKYGIPNLWQFWGIDRYFTTNLPKYEVGGAPPLSYDDILNHLQVRFRKITGMLEEKKPDAVIFSAVGSMGSLVLYWAAKRMGIKTYVIEHARIKERVLLNDNCYCDFTEVNDIFNSLQKEERQSKFQEESTAILKEFRESPHKRVWTESDALPILPRFSRWAEFFSRYLKIYIKEERWKDYLEEGPLSYLRNRIQRRLRKWIISPDIFEDSKEGEDYAYFPLHQEPEIATLLYAPFFTNQFSVAQTIAKALPVGFRLYVKDHPTMTGYRDKSFYEALKNIPNVRLIKSSADSISLVKNAKLITTITGTAGWEGIMLKKPVITFGSTFYNVLSMVGKCGALTQLPQLVKDALDNFQYSDKELINFMSALMESSTPLNYSRLWQK